MAPPTIAVNGNVLHHAARREGGVHFTPDVSHTNYLIIQAYHQLKPSQVEQLERLGVLLQRFLAGETYICATIQTILLSSVLCRFCTLSTLITPTMSLTML